MEAEIVAEMPKLQQKSVVRDNTADAFFGMADDLGAAASDRVFPLNSSLTSPVQTSSDMSGLLSAMTSRWPVIAVISSAVLLATVALILMFLL